MPFAGGFLGGGVEMTPAGYATLIMQWTTYDSLNLDGVTFTVNGTDTNVIEANATGYATVVVPVGSYIITCQHEGSYDGDGAKAVIAESTQSYFVMFYGAKIPETSPVFKRYTLGSESSTLDTSSVYSFLVENASLGDIVSLYLTVSPTIATGTYCNLANSVYIENIFPTTSITYYIGSDGASRVPHNLRLNLTSTGIIYVKGIDVSGQYGVSRDFSGLLVSSASAATAKLIRKVSVLHFISE